MGWKKNKELSNESEDSQTKFTKWHLTKQSEALIPNWKTCQSEFYFAFKFKQAVVTVVPEPGQSKVENFRPISLLEIPHSFWKRNNTGTGTISIIQHNINRKRNYIPNPYWRSEDLRQDMVQGIAPLHPPIKTTQGLILNIETTYHDYETPQQLPRWENRLTHHRQNN